MVDQQRGPLRHPPTHTRRTTAAIFAREGHTQLVAACPSRIEPLAKVARTLERKHDLVLNWFRANAAISSGAVEGLNNKLNVIVRRSYGFRSYDVTTNALYHGMGNLPEPAFPHRFC